MLQSQSSFFEFEVSVDSGSVDSVSVAALSAPGFLSSG